MDFFWFTVVLIFFSFLIQKLNQKQKKNLPPSPPSLPILGHLHLINKGPLHRSFHHLSTKYGPIIYLRFGNRPTLIVSSPSIAEECFTKNDIIFANRPPSIGVDYFSYNRTTMGSAPYGDHWRNIRRVSTIQIFSSTAIGRFSAVRLQEVGFILKKLVSNEIGKVNLNSLFFELVFNLIMKMVSGKRWVEPYDMFDADIPTGLSDFIPILRWFDFGGFEKKLQEFKEKGDNFLQDLVDETRRINGGISESAKFHKTLIESLLSLQEADPQFYTDDIIKGIILILFSAGTGTSALTMEWAMSLLLNHTEVMEKLRKEIEHNVPSDRLIDDSDLSKLPYLRCIINETLRLFPVAPILLPHMSSTNCTVSGYNISRNTTLMVNVWAIHRDPNIWEEPTKFMPERFEGFKADQSDGFKFFPFGIGRRACPGYGMGMRIIGLTLATLIQCFEWERIGNELVDLEEGSGFTLSKTKPLEALCRPRPAMINLLSQL
ncbi:hypothetical protein M9H77_32425 [Catharanthus roseus]|uniref:Uncharacterized protein n=1 Tax=Catharanthus roseus TaxID=4058 RepID=A0ACC0A747_CATRO|nr:hypothetical protein M9H77_32425 [Catharanthus roseus]